MCYREGTLLSLVTSLVISFAAVEYQSQNVKELMCCWTVKQNNDSSSLFWSACKSTANHSRVADSEIKYSTPTPTFPKFWTQLLNIERMKFGCQNEWKSWCREICFNKSFNRNCAISTGIPNLGVWFKRWSDWTSGVGQKSPTPSVVRNPTPHKNLRLRHRLRNPES